MPTYRADGTIHVRLDATGKAKAIMFIPEKSFEQGGGKFVVFVPCAEAKEGTRDGLVVRGKHIWLDLLPGQPPTAADQGASPAPTPNTAPSACREPGEPLLQAAVRGLKVTVLVSSASGGTPKLEEVVIPAIPT